MKVLVFVLELSLNEFLDDVECFGFGGVEVVVDDDAVELGCEGEFILGLVDALLDNFGGVGTTTFESAT